MSGMNQVTLYGNLAADPEVIPTKTGKTFTSFSLATNRNWRTKEGKTMGETNFHRIKAFGRLGELIGTHLKKGSPVLLSGRLNNRSYIAKDGGKRYVTEIVMEDFNFIGGRKEAAERAAAV